jgi:hypothetical protein
MAFRGRIVLQCVCFWGDDFPLIFFFLRAHAFLCSLLKGIGMAGSQTTRKLLLYRISAHLDGKSMNYTKLFKEVSALPIQSRMLERQKRFIAIPSIFFAQHRVFCVAYQGTVGLNPMFFNRENAQERIEPLGEEEILATKTHVVIDPEKKRAVIEYNHNGAKASDVALILQTAAANVEGWSDVVLEFTPVPAMEFLQAIKGFERISSASIVVVKPNPGWTDDYTTLTKVGEDSHAQSVELSASAGRGGSLSKTKGIVKFITDMAEGARTYMKNAHVTGSYINTLGLSTVSLERYTEHKKAVVETDEDGHVRTEDIQTKMTDYLGS